MNASISHSGRYLAVDLTRQKAEVRELPERWLLDYLGGAGLGMRLLVEWTGAGADPLDPETAIVFASGALSGTMAPASASHAVATRSPLTGFLASSVSSGAWSLALARTGLDAVVITGAAASPLYLFIDDGRVHFRQATALAGQGCPQTESAIRREAGDSRVQVASIGPAGESLVRFATIRDGHLLPHRGGAGAVMGAKKLKAIAVRGTRPIAVADIGAMSRACRDLNAALHESAAARRGELGPEACLAGGPCPLAARNYQQALAGGAGSLAAECAGRERLLKAIACPTCPIACLHVYRLTGDPDSEEQAVLDREALAALGPLCGMFHLPVIMQALELCHFYGLDPVSAGASVAWAMEGFERGTLSSEETQRLDLSFGSADGVVESIRRIGQRRGLGQLLGEGVRRASASLGRGSDAWAMHVKGLEIAGCDPRGSNGLALGLAVGLAVPALDDGGGTPPAVRDQEDLAAAASSTGVCARARGFFPGFPAAAARLYSLATGRLLDAAEMTRAGERANNLARAFNIREGWKRADDWLPARLFKEPAVAAGTGGAAVAAGTSGAAVAGRAVVSETELAAAIDEYYRARGWSAGGLIPDEKLTALDMDDVREALKGSRDGAPPHPVR